MKDFHFLFAAWMIVWAVFFGYEVSVARRVSALREEIARLKQLATPAGSQGRGE